MPIAQSNAFNNNPERNLMNKLLIRQMRRALKEEQTLSPEMEKLMSMVSDSYDHFERDRMLIERAMTISSEELRESYEKVEHQEALKQSNDKLQHFVAIASHDLKAPLRTIGAFSQLLHRKIKPHLDEAGEEYLKFILEGVTRMNTLIADLICFSKLDNQVDQPVPIDCNKILEKVKLNLHSTISDCEAEVVIKENFPHVVGLGFQMIQLFQNIIGNALKFRGDKLPVVKVDWEKIGEDVLVSVQDNGIGIAPDHQSKVFDAFLRLNNTKDYEGSGLGLAICKKIMDNLGGDISVKSELGVGTTFYFRIPGAKVVWPEMA